MTLWDAWDRHPFYCLMVVATVSGVLASGLDALGAALKPPQMGFIGCTKSGEYLVSDITFGPKGYITFPTDVSCPKAR